MLSTIIFNVKADMNPAMAMALPPATGWFEIAMNNFNTSPYFIGFMMLTMNLGSRFLGLEMSKGQEAFFSHPWIRRFLIFVVFFIGTRNVWVAFWMALVSILLLGYLFNENSSLCIFKGGLPGAACTKPEASIIPPTQMQGNQQQGPPNAGNPPNAVPSVQGFQNPHALTPDEQMIHKQLSDKLARAQAAAVPPAPETKPDLYGSYKSNMDAVKKLF